MIARAPLPAPLVMDELVDEPERIRRLAHIHAPYSFQDRPGGLVWPTWRGEWAVEGELLIEGAELMLDNERLAAAATELCGGPVSPHAVYANLGTPCPAQPVSHVDLANFRGIERDAVPDWFRQVMGVSGLFDDARIVTITAVCWFHRGPRGHYRYWPTGRDAAAVTHTAMWNTGVVGLNDRMHHQVERIGDVAPPPDLDATATLCSIDGGWEIRQDNDVLAAYADEQVRMSVSWVAVRTADLDGSSITLDDVVDRLARAVAGEIEVETLDDLLTDDARQTLVARWPGYLPV